MPNPELYYKIGNASTIISTMGTPVVKGVPIEKVMATQAKRLASGAVGSIASNAIMDRYDLNPYVAMGIGMGISGLTYRGINAVGNMDYVNRFGVKSAEAVEDVKVVNKVSVDEKESFSSYGDLMSPEEETRYSKYWTIKSSKCSTEGLYKYLNNIEPDISETYLKTGQWPNEIQVPKSSNVLNVDGSIKWSEVPGGGYTLDSKGKPIKDSYIPNIGEILDRYGTPDGRYTSPIINKMPYSYDQRSLPYVEEVSQYHQYEVTGNFEKLESYINKCSDTKLKMKIDAYVDKYYG